MVKTTFERLTECDFEVFENEDLAIMLKEIKIEIDKREKKKWHEYFYKVIEDIEDLIETFGDKNCFFVELEGRNNIPITWEELKEVLMNYDLERL